MDVYKGHGEGETKWKGCAWKLLLFKFNIKFYYKFTIRLFFFGNTLKIHLVPLSLLRKKKWFVKIPYYVLPSIYKILYKKLKAKTNDGMKCKLEREVLFT